MKRLFIIPIVAVFSASTLAQSRQIYEGHWWQSAAADERDGFLTGCYDCYVWDAHGNDYSNDSIIQQVAAVTEYYQNNDRSALVLNVLKKLLHGRLHSARRGERHGEPHEELDGDYWRQAGSDGRAGYVRGYLMCQENHLKAQVEKPFSDYVAAISRYYGVSDSDESALNDDTANDKVANVLSRIESQGRP